MNVMSHASSNLLHYVPQLKSQSFLKQEDDIEPLI